MNITSRQLKAFLLTARHQSFSRAAEQLFITQSGMSVLVRELESQLGFQLFERTTRKVTLTRFGFKFLPIADKSLLELEAAAVSIGRSAGVAGGRLTIGAAPLVAATVLPPAIAEYQTRAPRLHIRLIDAEISRLTEMLLSGDLDVAITIGGAALHGIRRAPLMRFSLIAITGCNLAIDLPHVARWSDLANRRLVGFPSDYPVQQLIDQQLARAGRRAPPDVVCNYLETQIAMVEVGAGIGIVPSYSVPACAKRKIAVHALGEPTVSGSLYWVTSRARKLPEAAEGFSAYLKEYLSGQAAHWQPDARKAA
jgi:LysR family transcriptional regulator, carnitine catabolism transcriptional activator